jgi:hypothetical protein
MIPASDLLEWLEAKPFMPFRLHLSDGRTFDIRGANQVWPGRQTAVLGFPSADDPRLIDRHTTVSLLHIVSVEPLEQSAP